MEVWPVQKTIWVGCTTFQADIPAYATAAYSRARTAGVAETSQPPPHSDAHRAQPFAHFHLVCVHSGAYIYKAPIAAWAIYWHATFAYFPFIGSARF